MFPPFEASPLFWSPSPDVMLIGPPLMLFAVPFPLVILIAPPTLLVEFPLVILMGCACVELGVRM